MAEKLTKKEKEFERLKAAFFEDPNTDPVKGTTVRYGMKPYQALVTLYGDPYEHKPRETKTPGKKTPAKTKQEEPKKTKKSKNESEEDDEPKKTKKSKKNESEEDDEPKKTKKSKNASEKDDKPKKTKKSKNESEEDDKPKKTKKSKNESEEEPKKTKKSKNESEEDDEPKKTKKSKNEEEPKKTKKSKNESEEEEPKKTKKSKESEEEPKKTKNSKKNEEDEESKKSEVESKGKSEDKNSVDFDTINMPINKIMARCKTDKAFEKTCNKEFWKLKFYNDYLPVMNECTKSGDWYNEYKTTKAAQEEALKLVKVAIVTGKNSCQINMDLYAQFFNLLPELMIAGKDEKDCKINIECEFDEDGYLGHYTYPDNENWVISFGDSEDTSATCLFSEVLLFLTKIQYHIQNNEEIEITNDEGPLSRKAVEDAGDEAIKQLVAYKMADYNACF